MATKRRTLVGIAGLAVVVCALVATWILSEAAEPDPVVPPTAEEAEALLDDAVRLVQADNYDGLCEELGSTSNCKVHLQEAERAGLVPSSAKPDIVEVTQLGADEVSLRLHGTYADGESYETEFNVSRVGEQLHVSNAVYWLPIQYLQPSCEHKSGQSECSATGSPPTQ